MDADPATWEPGEVIVEAVSMALAIQEVVLRPDGMTFVWQSNAPEQIEAALAQLGWDLVRSPAVRN